MKINVTHSLSDLYIYIKKIIDPNHIRWDQFSYKAHTWTIEKKILKYIFICLYPNSKVMFAQKKIFIIT